MKFIKICIVSVLLGAAHIAYSQPYQLIPCNDLFKRSRPSALVYDGLTKMVNTAVDHQKNQVVFTMLLCPNRQSERAIVVCKNQEGDNYVEIVASPIDTNYSILDQVETRFKNLKDVPSNPVIDLPQMESKGKRKIASTTAEIVRKALEAVLAKRGLNENDRDEKREVVCIPGILTRYFIGKDDSCGLMTPVPYTGAPRRLAELGDVLEKFVKGKLPEKKILESAKKVE